MFCSLCGKEQKREDAKFCWSCGENLLLIASKKKVYVEKPEVNNKSIIEKMVDEQSKSYEKTIVPTSQGKRFLHLIIDLIFINLMVFFLDVFLLLCKIYTPDEIDKYSRSIGVMIFIAYYFFMEYFWGKTIAKFITRTKVVTENGKKPDGKNIIIRTFVRIIGIEAFSFFGSKNPIGFHDIWSSTLVVDDI